MGKLYKKDFNEIAADFKRAKPDSFLEAEAYAQWLKDVKLVTAFLPSTNMSFDRVRFYDACGVD